MTGTPMWTTGVTAIALLVLRTGELKIVSVDGAEALFYFSL